LAGAAPLTGLPFAGAVLAGGLSLIRTVAASSAFTAPAARLISVIAVQARGVRLIIVLFLNR
jgi:hypothetical protein